MGHRVAVAASGEEALKLIPERSLDLVLMDIQMPGMNGFETTAVIRSWEMGSANHLPIIALTADALGGIQDRCRAAGMDDYIAKPFDVEDLAAKLAKCGNRARDGRGRREGTMRGSEAVTSS
jgi:two-component system sensor histidine kinase/response regulator